MKACQNIVVKFINFNFLNQGITCISTWTKIHCDNKVLKKNLILFVEERADVISIMVVSTFESYSNWTRKQRDSYFTQNMFILISEVLNLKLFLTFC